MQLLYTSCPYRNELAQSTLRERFVITHKMTRVISDSMLSGIYTQSLPAVIDYHTNRGLI